jgi:hypothetical protein
MVGHVLSPAQRAALFNPPSDPGMIQRLYTLGPDDLVEVFRRRRPANRLGYAVVNGGQEVRLSGVDVDIAASL